MDFEFSADQEMLRTSVRRLLGDRAPLRPYVRDRYEQESVGVDDVWRGLSDLGVVGLLVPAAYGGAGAGMVDAAVVLEELGRAVCPVPYVSTAVAFTSLVTTAGDADDQSRLLPPVATGSTIATIAVHEPGRRYAWRDPATTARRDGDRFRVDGEKVHVPDAPAATQMLVTARDDDGALAVLALETGSGTAGVSAIATPTVDGSRKQGRVTFDGAVARRLGGGDAVRAVASTLDRIAVAHAVDGVGAAARALELAVEYAQQRVQFDRPIGAFQAVQHLCADMLRAVELGRAAAYYACWAADEAGAAEAHRAATIAAAYAADAFPDLGATAIQVFGGIGFTWEHDIHLFYKRLCSNTLVAGTADAHLAELARLAIDPVGEEAGS